MIIIHYSHAQKEEMGDFLHEVDFRQLKIENDQCMAKIEEQKAEMLELKMTADAAQKELSIFKVSLSYWNLEMYMGMEDSGFPSFPWDSQGNGNQII